MSRRKTYKEVDGVYVSTCNTCNEVKPVTDFRKKRSYGDGYIYYFPTCKVCERAANLARHYRLYKDNQHARKSGYRYILKTAYSLTEKDFIKMYNDQMGCCDICGTKIRNPFISMDGDKQAVDHCHVTGKIRGLLCHVCNVGLGSFKDSVENLQKAIKYVNKHKDVVL